MTVYSHPVLRRSTWVAMALLASGLLPGGTSPAHAHSGEHSLQVDRAPLGDLALTVWTGPSTLRPGDILLESLVTDPGSDDAVEGMQLSYTVVGDSTHHRVPPQVLPAAAVVTLSERNKQEELHLAVVRLLDAGRYEVTASVVAGPLAGQLHRFSIDIFPDNPAFQWAIKILGVLTLLLTAAFVMHTLRRIRLWWRWRGEKAAGYGY